MANDNGSEFDGSTVGDADAAAEAMAAQMRANPGADIRPSATPDPLASDELDKMFDESAKDEKPVDPYAESKRQSGITDDTQEEKPAADAPKADEKPAEAKPTEEKPAKKGPLDDLLGEEKPAEKPAEKKDPYDEIKLRPDASPKTRETFENMKTTAREREKAAQDRAAALEKTVSELSERVKATEGKTATPEVEAELKELREFRAQFDTENDPTFKSKYNTKLDQNYETIYSKLKEQGLKDDVLATLKSMSQSERDENIERFLTKIPTAARRLIEAKLVENVSVSEQRKAELQEVRSKADQILAERAKAPVETVEKLQTEVATLLAPELKKLDWIQLKEIPAGIAGEEKAKLEKANEFAGALQTALRNAILDHSATSKARGALAIPMAHYYRARTTELETELTAVKKELDGIRAASRTSRTARTSASPNPAVRVENKPERSSEDTIDDLFDQATKGQG